MTLYRILNALVVEVASEPREPKRRMSLSISYESPTRLVFFDRKQNMRQAAAAINAVSYPVDVQYPV